MKDIIKKHLQKLNETSIKIFRDYNPEMPHKSRWTVAFSNGGTFTYTYDNRLEWNGLVL